MSVIILIGLGLIVGIVARTTVNHSLVLAAVVVVASSGWASPSSAMDAPDAWIATAAKVRLIANSNTPARDINVDTAADEPTAMPS